MPSNRGVIRTRGFAKGFATAILPLTIATLAARPLEASAEAPPWLPLGDLATGSSSSTTGAEPVGDVVGSGSSFGPGATSSGSAADPAPEGASSGGSLSLGPVRIPSGSAGPGDFATGSAHAGLLATGDAGLEDATPLAANPATHSNGTTGSPAETLELDSGSVQAACSGSAVTGSALLVLGLATGSGFGSLGSSLIGPGSSLIGPGSSGSSLGSAAVGSALTGSALLTCLLLVPTAPPMPMNPLQLEPPAPEVRIAPSPAAGATRTQLQAPPPLAERPPSPQNRPRGRDVRAAEPPGDPDTWNLMRLMTVLVVTVLTVVGIRTAPGSRRLR